jgi:hypothetical protein
MLGSITPLGERGRRSRWHLTVCAYVVGSVLGAVVVGSTAGLLGMVALRVLMLGPGPRLLAIGGFAFVSVVLDLGLVIDVPTTRRQVNEDWLGRYRGWVYGGSFGLQLGVGLFSVVPTAALYLTVALELASGSVSAGAAIGCCFGVARALPLLSARSATSPPLLRELHEGLERWRAVAGLATIGAEATLTLTALSLTGVVWR